MSLFCRQSRNSSATTHCEYFLAPLCLSLSLSPLHAPRPPPRISEIKDGRRVDRCQDARDHDRPMRVLKVSKDGCGDTRFSTPPPRSLPPLSVSLSETEDGFATSLGPMYIRLPGKRIAKFYGQTVLKSFVKCGQRGQGVKISDNNADVICKCSLSAL